MQVKQEYSAAFFSYLFLSLYIKPAHNFKTPSVFYEKVQKMFTALTSEAPDRTFIFLKACFFFSFYKNWSPSDNYRFLLIFMLIHLTIL